MPPAPFTSAETEPAEPPLPRPKIPPLPAKLPLPAAVEAPSALAENEANNKAEAETDENEEEEEGIDRVRLDPAEDDEDEEDAMADVRISATPREGKGQATACAGNFRKDGLEDWDDWETEMGGF